MVAYASPRPATNRMMKISPGNGLAFRMGKTSIAASGVVARALAASHQSCGVFSAGRQSLPGASRRIQILPPAPVAAKIVIAARANRGCAGVHVWLTIGKKEGLDTSAYLEGRYDETPWFDDRMSQRRRLDAGVRPRSVDRSVE